MSLLNNDYGLTNENNFSSITDNNNTKINDDQLNTKINIDKNSNNAGNRKLKPRSSVILAKSGLRVQRSDSFLDDNNNHRNNITYNDNDNDNDNDDNDNETTHLISSRSKQINNQNQTNNDNVSKFNKLKSIYSIISTSIRQTYYNEIFRSVIKCSLAYLIASLGVYWTSFDNFLGNTDSKHVVATVAVYFHPSRSKGSMHQTLIFVIISLIYSISISFTCRSISTFFYNKGQDEISYTIDLIISSIGLGFISFMKQKINKQTFNTACSLASISLVTCIVKEGSLNSAFIPLKRLISTSQVVVIGSIISVSICYLLWPISAVNELKNCLNDSFKLMSMLLSIYTSKFLIGENFDAKDLEILNNLKKNNSKLNSFLEESKFELRLLGKETEFIYFTNLVKTTIALSKHLQALKSSIEMRWNLLNEDSQSIEVNSSINSSKFDLQLSSSIENLDNINDDDDDDSVSNYTVVDSNELFDLFVNYLAPSMKSFIFTIKGVLNEVSFAKNHNNNEELNILESENFQNSLKSAIDLFQNKQIESFKKLYSQEIFKESNRNLDSKANQEEITACCGNFSSLTVLFGKELINFFKISQCYNDTIEDSSRSWNWLKFWNHNKKSPENILKTNINHLNHGKVESSLNVALLNLQSKYNSSQNLVSSSSSSPIKKSTIASDTYFYKAWKALKVFRRTDVQFGIRVGLGAFFISFFAFYPKTKLTFSNWRGEWSLVIYCIMMNKSLGGTTMTVKWRFIGTFIGASTAYFIWILTNGNVYALSITGFLISIPSFYIIIFWKSNNPFGRFILLTYNLTALYSYGMTQKDSEDDNEGGENPIVGEIAFHRFVSVSVGVLWALIMASCFLPNSARARLKTGLTILWLRMGVIWKSNPLDYKESLIGNQGDKEYRLIGLKDENEISDLLNECETLLKQAPLEFRLKGSFPKSTYSKLLVKTSSIIDAFQNINLMVEVDPILTLNEKYVIDYIEAERNEVDHRIFLIFYMIASAMKLGFPIPSKPASTEHAKDRLLYKLHEFRTKSSFDSDTSTSLTNEDYVLLYSYILVTSAITSGLDEIIELIKDLLGDVNEEIFQLV